MEWLNYHHLLYFWSVAKHGSVRKACEELRLAQPTISAQIRVLEEALGEQLFARSGRRLILTEVGRDVFRYAEDIFFLGRELMDTVKGRSGKRSLHLAVGIADVVPKLLAAQMLKPAFKLARIVCWENTLERLLADLAIHKLDLVIADMPAPPTVNIRAHSHLMGKSGVTLFAAAKIATRYRRNFPQSLDGAPFLLPTSNSTIRQLIDTWLSRKELPPIIIGECEDSATLKAIGHDGHGIFPGSTVMEKEICRQYQVRVLGRMDGVELNVYAITTARRLEHPGARAIFETARRELLS